MAYGAALGHDSACCLLSSACPSAGKKKERTRSETQASSKALKFNRGSGHAISALRRLAGFPVARRADVLFCGVSRGRWLSKGKTKKARKGRAVTRG